MKKDNQIILYNDDVCEYATTYRADICEDLKAMDIEENDANIFDEARRQIDASFEDMRHGLAYYDYTTTADGVLVEAVLGLWYGKRKVHKFFDSLEDAVLFCFEDINKLYFANKRNALTLRATHHDGENYFKFYKIINKRKYAIKLDDLEGGF